MAEGFSKAGEEPESIQPTEQLLISPEQFLADMTAHIQMIQRKIKDLGADWGKDHLQLQAERETVLELEGQVQRLRAQHEGELATSQARAAQALTQLKEKESVEEQLKGEMAFLQAAVEAAHQEVARNAAKLEQSSLVAALALEAVAKDLATEKLERAKLEAQVQELGQWSHPYEPPTLEGCLAHLRALFQQQEREVGLLSSQVRQLQATLEEARGQKQGLPAQVPKRAAATEKGIRVELHKEASHLPEQVSESAGAGLGPPTPEPL